MTKKIELSRGKVAVVDDEDYEWLSQWGWSAGYFGSINGFYAMRSEHLGYVNGKRKRRTVYMHRSIVNAPKGLQVDHVNHNPLDNRKCNLRVCTHRQNHQNQKPKTSRYPGVHKCKVSNKWRAQISVEGKVKHLGAYEDESEAAKAYERACRELVEEELI